MKWDPRSNSEAGFDTSTNVVSMQLLPGQTPTVYSVLEIKSKLETSR